MQWSLFLLLLMGQCSFFMCHLHEYHFVEEEKNWTEAQQYCREHHTDLATVSNMTDMERLRDSAQNQDGAWIGLYNLSKSTAGEDNRMWHWSLPGVEFNDTNTKWAPGEPNDINSPENCVCIRNNSWLDFHCTEHKHAFICYDERKQSNKTFHLIDKEMSWPQAQNYCREHHTDLVSGDQQLEDDEFKTEIKSDTEVWIGLFRDSWRWSDGSSFSFRYWKSFTDEEDDQCAMTKLDDDDDDDDKKKNGKWKADKCDHKKPFFCYNGTTTKKGTTAGPSSSTVTEDKTQEPTTKKGTTAGPSSSTVTEDKTQGTTTKKGTTAGPSSSTVTEDKTQGTTTKKGTTAGPSSSTVTEDKTQDKVILIKENKTWEEALNYCREKHCDLVSITNPDQQRWVQEKAKKADTTHVWLGLRYTCVMDLWFWVNDNAVCYPKWASEEKTESCDRAAAMSREEGHEWFQKADNETFNFICTVK